MENIKYFILLDRINSYGSNFVNKKITNRIQINANNSEALRQFNLLQSLINEHLLSGQINEDEYTTALTELNALYERIKISAKRASIYPEIKLPKKNRALQKKLAFGQYSKLLQNITPSVRAVMRVIEVESIRNGVCTLSVKHIGDLAGVSRSTVQLALRILRKPMHNNNPLIEIGSRPVKNGPHLTNVIRIVCPVWIDLIKTISAPEALIGNLYGFKSGLRGLKKLSSMLNHKYISTAFFMEMAKAIPALMLMSKYKTV